MQSSPPSLHEHREHITGLVLAGGQGSRMGGVDKGLLPLLGQPLAQWCAQRLAAQVGQVLINANQNRAVYESWGWRVVADLPDGDVPSSNEATSQEAPASPLFAGPLAGFAAGLTACTTPWLLTVACDTPRFPADLAQRLLQAAHSQNALIAMACTPANAAFGSNKPVPQPAFCLLHHSLAASVQQFVQQGGRKIRQWTAQHATTMVVFDEADAFYNANTPADLAHLEHLALLSA